VMPSGFTFPDGNPVDVYAPLVFAQDELNGRRLHTLSVIGRLNAGASIDDARADIGTIARRIAATDATSNPEVTIAGAHDVLVEDVRLGLLILLGTVGFVLLIACANVANLLLVRAASRRREIAIRVALGAGSRRLLRQLLTESVLLAGIGAVAGMAAAWWLLRVLVRYGPPDLPRVDQVGIDTPVLLFVTAVALVTGVAFGMAPALQASRPHANAATKGGRHVTTASFGRGRGRSILLVTEIALSLMLLAGAGLMVRSLLNLQNLDLGFQPADVLTAQIFLSPSRYPIDATQFRPRPSGSALVPDSKPAAFFAQLEERLQSTSGIEFAGAVSALPLDPAGTDYDLPVVIQGKPRPRAGEEPQADFRIATVGYFRAMRIPLLKGRAFTDFDGPNATPVVVINDTMASQLFPGVDPLGQRLILYGRPREIVGIVGSVRHRGFARDARPEMILPSRQFHLGGMTLAVRSRMEPSALRAAVAEAVHSIDAAQPVFRLRTMEEFLSDSVAQPRFTTLLLGGFAALALLLALVGVYGVMSYSVAQRAREIGVRMVVRQGMTLAAAGVLIGLVGSAVGTRVMAGLLFGVTATDPVSFMGAATALVLASLAATSVPAFRAARVAPITILKSE
jgi:putative ABC transport system permease protein